MTLRIDKIEIRQQPEKKRYWAEVEVYCDTGFRCRHVIAPEADGRDAFFAALKAQLDELDPPAVQPEPAVNPNPYDNIADWTWPTTLSPSEFNDAARKLHAERGADIIQAEVAALDALRAEAEAAGVRVDGRWGEARLRQEIAAAGREEAPQDA